jgi:hypothetical protein
VVRAIRGRPDKEGKLRQLNVRLPRTVTLPRIVGLIIALTILMLISGTFIWALYLSEQYIILHWKVGRCENRSHDHIEWYSVISHDHIKWYCVRSLEYIEWYCDRSHDQVEW